jgi:hypothetical protein
MIGCQMNKEKILIISYFHLLQDTNLAKKDQKVLVFREIPGGKKVLPDLSLSLPCETHQPQVSTQRPSNMT